MENIKYKVKASLWLVGLGLLLVIIDYSLSNRRELEDPHQETTIENYIEGSEKENEHKNLKAETENETTTMVKSDAGDETTTMVKPDAGDETTTMVKPDAENETAMVVKPQEELPQGVDLEDYSNVPKDNGNPYYIKVNRLANVVTVYGLDEEGYYKKPIRAMVCSVGKDSRTPLGTFATKEQYEWRYLYGAVFGQYAYRIQGAIMFHSVPYYSMNKNDVEMEEYNKLGEKASLGCVRLSVADARWICENCPRGTLVTIYDDVYPGPLGKPVGEHIVLPEEDAIASGEASSGESSTQETSMDEERALLLGWDPTDSSPENPYHQLGLRIIGAGNRTLQRGSTFDLTQGVWVYGADGQDYTESLKVYSNLDINQVGEYQVFYEGTDQDGQVVRQISSVTVVDVLPPKVIVPESPIKLNKIQASVYNRERYIAKNVELLDEGTSLGKEYMEIELEPLEEEKSGVIYGYLKGRDAAGNETASYSIALEIDYHAPEIKAPVHTSFKAENNQAMRSLLEDAVEITDDYSGVEEVSITWTKNKEREYMLMVTAKDGFGNVATSFFEGYHLEFQE